MLKENQNNIKGTWKILNDVIGNNHGPRDLPKHFINDDNKIIKNTKDVANEFNYFFVNVGPNLANSINKCRSK